MMEWIVTSSAMILIIIALRGLLKCKISLKLQYGLWALVLIRLLLPFSIVDSAISVSNLLSAPVIREADDAVADYETAYQSAVQRHESSGTDYTDTEIRQQVQQELFDRTYEKIESQYTQTGAVVSQVQIQAEAQQQVEVISLTAVLTEALPYFWIAGMIVVEVALIGSNLHFWWKLRQSRKALDISGVPLKVYLTDYVATPCLFGTVKPDIYLTNEVMADSQMRRHVIAHELSHYRQGDHIWSMLRCVCLVLHWYNPLVWVAAILSKQDAELACDEATIKALGENERTAYGRTLIGMTCVRRDPGSLMLTATTMLGTKKTLKERIALIAKKPTTALYTLIACILVVSLAVGCTFTGAPAQTEEEKLLDRCRKAVEYIQNLEYFEITEHYEFIEESDYIFGHSPVEARYVHSGDDWFHTRVTPDWTWQFLEKDGEQFRKDITDAVPEEDIPAPEWRPEDLSENHYASHAWIMDLHWGEDAIELLTYTGNGDGYEGGKLIPRSVSSATEGSVELITVELEFGAEQTVNDIEQGALWILTFRFDLYSGDVTEVKREIVMEDREINTPDETVNVNFRSTSTLSIYPGTEEEMSAIIDGIYYNEIATVVPGPVGATEPITEPTEPHIEPTEPPVHWIQGRDSFEDVVVYPYTPDELQDAVDVALSILDGYREEEYVLDFQVHWIAFDPVGTDNYLQMYDPKPTWEGDDHYPLWIRFVIEFTVNYDHTLSPNQDRENHLGYIMLTRDTADGAWVLDQGMCSDSVSGTLASTVVMPLEEVYSIGLTEAPVLAAYRLVVDPEKAPYLEGQRMDIENVYILYVLDEETQTVRCEMYPMASSEPPKEPATLPYNTWTTVSAVLVNDQGKVLENLELTVNAMTWEEDGRGYYNLRFDYPETVHNSGPGVLPYGDYEYPYTCSNGIGVEKGPEGKHAWTYYVGFDPEMGSFIVDFDDGENVYLIAYWGANKDIPALWDHFRDFITMSPLNINEYSTEPTTEPTEPPSEPVLDWDIPDYPQLTYDEYFSETRYYYYAAQGENPRQQYYWGGWNNGKDKCEVWMEDGMILAGSSLSGKYVQVGTETYKNTKITCCDEFWIYAIKDRTELFRIDYNGENRQTLYVDETQKIAPFDITYTHVRDNSVLFFVAAAGSDYGIYRLYLPDMTLDLLYTTEAKPFLYGPYSNYEITWSSDVKEVVNNVYEIDYYYNCLTGELLERPVYGDRSWGNTTWPWWEEMLEPTEPTVENIELNLTGMVVDADGNIKNHLKKNINVTIRGTRTDNAEGYDELELDMSFSDNYRYVIGQFPTISISSDSDYILLDYDVCPGFGYDGVAEITRAMQFAMCTDREYLILEWEGVDNEFLVASADPDTTPTEIIEYFREYLELFSFSRTASS